MIYIECSFRTEGEEDGNMSPTSFGGGGAEARNLLGGLTGQVTLTKGSRKRCWFRLMPRFKGQGKADGDKVLWCLYDYLFTLKLLYFIQR